ncbi:PEP-CTERM sorting domain-containing protein [Candidatus Parcubacteria bacterium]|nr:PEP-CTERM sorting domain-containing protein [Candidatus Parcubacteria bacterium]
MKTFLVSIVVLSSVAQVAGSIYYADFSSVAGLNFRGTAIQTGNEIRLTPASQFTAGAIWQAEKKRFVAGGFDTTFQFWIPPSSNPGDGLAFVIQNDSALALGDTGASKGYGGIPNSIAVQFDTYVDKKITVQTRGVLPNSPNVEYALGRLTIGSLSDGFIHTARIVYGADASMMEVYLDNPATSVFGTSVDLETLLDLDNGGAYVGFTAGTGEFFEEHRLLNWTFQSTGAVPEPSAMVAIGLLSLVVLKRRRI